MRGLPFWERCTLPCTTDDHICGWLWLGFNQPATIGLSLNMLILGPCSDARFCHPNGKPHDPIIVLLYEPCTVKASGDNLAHADPRTLWMIVPCIAPWLPARCNQPLKAFPVSQRDRPDKEFMVSLVPPTRKLASFASTTVLFLLHHGGVVKSHDIQLLSSLLQKRPLALGTAITPSTTKGLDTTTPRPSVNVAATRRPDTSPNAEATWTTSSHHTS